MADGNSQGAEISGGSGRGHGSSQSNGVPSRTDQRQNSNHSHQNPPIERIRPPSPPPVRQARQGDDIMQQYYVRGLLVLVIAIAAGYLYLQLETPPMSRHKLVPNEFSYIKKDSSVVNRKSAASSPPASQLVEASESSSEDSSPVVRYDSYGRPYVDPKFEQHSQYLTRVVQTIGRLTRRLEEGNITKPLGGIVEMRAEAQEEEEDIPEYMKRLGNIIDDIQKTKNHGKKYEKFHSSITKSQFTDPQKLKEREEKRRKWKEELLAEQEEQEANSNGDPWGWDSLSDDVNNIVGENDDEVIADELTEDEKGSLDDDEEEDYAKIAENLNKFWKKFEEEEAAQEGKLFDFEENDDIEAVGKKSEESLEKLMERAEKLKVGLEMIKVMMELESEKGSQAKRKRSEETEEEESEPSFRNEESYAL